MKLKVADRYMNCTVCLPDEVIRLSGKVSQAKLRKLHTMGLPHVEIVEEESTEEEEISEDISRS